MNDILYVYDEDQNQFRPFDIFKKFGSVRQICKGFSENSYQILSETGCLYYISYEVSFYQLPFRNEKVKYITTNSKISIALSYTGQVYSFGDDTQQYGILGLQKQYFASSPTKIGSNFESICLSEKMAAGIDHYGKMWMWGECPIGKIDSPEQIDLQLNCKITKINVAKDYAIIIDVQSKIHILCDTFKLTTEYYKNQNWVLHQVQQLNNEHLVVSEIIPGEKYSLILTNKHQLHMISNQGDRMIARKLAINIQIYNITQSDTYIYCFSATGKFLKIDKANLYTNEQQEIRKIYEQFTNELTDQEQKMLNNIKPMYLIKRSLNQLQSFQVDKHRYINGLQSIPAYQGKINESVDNHLQQTNIKLNIIQHQSNSKSATPIKTPIRTSFQKTSSNYNQLKSFYSPQLSNLQYQKKTTSQLLLYTPQQTQKYCSPARTFLNKSPNLQNSAQRSFIPNEITNCLQSTIKKANLTRHLIQDVNQTINIQCYQYESVQYEPRDRTTSSRSSSVYQDQDIVRNMIKELGSSRAQSQERERISSIINKPSKYDHQINLQMQTVRKQLDGLQGLQNQSKVNSNLSFNQSNLVKSSGVRNFFHTDEKIKNNVSQEFGLPKSGDVNFPRLKQLQISDQEKLNNQVQQSDILFANFKNRNKLIQTNQQQMILSELNEEIEDGNQFHQQISQIKLYSNDMKDKVNKYQQFQQPPNEFEYLYVEEQLVMNPTTKQYEIKKVQVASKQSKLASDNLNEVNEAGTKIVSRQLIKKSVKPKDNQEQSEEEEDVTYVYEEEQLVLNPKTKQYEIKKVQVASKQSKLASDNLNEVNKAGTKIVSRQLIKKSVKPKDNQEQSQEEEDVTYVYEEEQLVLNPKTKQYEIKKVQVASKQSKLASDNLNEVNEAGTKIVSRQLIKKSVKPKDNQEQSEEEEEEEDVTYVYEEEQLVLNPKTKQYEIKKVQVASKQSKLASDNLNEVNEAGTKIVSRQLIKKSVKPKDNQEQSEEEEDVTYVYEEEQLVLNPKTKQYEIKKVQVASKQSKLASDNLNEVNEAGTKIVSRQLIKKSVKPKDNQEQSEEEEDVTYVYEEEQLVLNPKTKQYEIKKVQVASKQSKLASDNLNEVNEAGTKIVSRQLIKKSVKPKDNQEQSEEEEDVTYVYEEEQLVLNPKTKQYEIKKVQVASKQSKLASDNLNEVNEAGTKIVSRQLIKKSVKPKDNQEQSEEEEEEEDVTYVYEEEQLVLNPKTKQYEIKKVQVASKQSKLASDNLNEVNEAGTKIVSRQLIKKSVKPKDNQEQSEEEEDVTYVYEEEQLVLNPKTKQYEIKKVQVASKQSKLASDNLNEVNEAGTKIVSRQLIKKSVKPKDNQEQSEEEEDVTYVYEEEQLVLNPKTKQYEIKKVQVASKQSKLASDNLNEVNEAGTKIVSRQLIKKSVKPKDNQEQSEEEEDVTYVYEEEQLVLNPKTKQYEIKKVQVASKQSKLASDNLNEVNEAGTKIVSRQLIKKSVKPKDNQEQSEEEEEEEDVTYVYEEEQLVLNPKTKQYEIKKVQVASKQSKLASDNLNEVNEAGTKIVSRQLIKKSVKPKDNQEQSEEEEDVTYVYEEEQLVLNPKTKQYEIKKVQVASKQSKLASDNLNEVNEAGTKIVSRQLIKKSVKPKDNQEQSEEEEDVTYVYEEEQLVLNPKTKQYEIKKVQVASKQSKLASDNLNEVNEAGTKIVSRQLIKKSVKPKDNQEQSEEEEDVTYVYEEEQLVLNPKTKQYEIKKVQVASKQSKLASDNLNEVNEAGTKIVSRQLIKKSVKPKDNQEQSEEEEDVTYVYEEEQLVLNPKTKQYEIKKVQVASKQSKLASDNLNEVNEAGTKIVSRQLIKKSVKPKDNQEQSEEEEDVTYVYEEEQLVLNPKTKQYEIKKVQVASKQSKLASDNLNEVNEAGTKIVSRQLIKKSVKPKDNQEQSEEEEDVTYVYEEEQLVLNPKTKQYEIKKVQVASKQSKLASDNLNEVNEAGTKIVSRQLIKKSVKPKDNQEQSEEEEDVTYVYEEEQLVLNPKTKQYEIKKVQVASKQSKLASDNLNEVNEAGTKIVSRQLIKKSVKPKDNQEQSEEEEDVTYVYEEEQLVLNPKTKQYEIKKVQVASKQSKLASDNLNEVNEAGTKIVSRQLIKKSVKPKDNQEQSEEEEDVTYVYEEEQLVLNPKTKQYEIKKVQVASKQSKLASDNLNEVNEAGTKTVSRQLIKKSVKPKDNQEQSEEEEYVTYVYEEEQLVLNPKTKQYEIKKVQVASKQSKLASDNLNEVNEAGTKIVSRQLIKKSVKPKDNQEQSEEEEDVTYVYEEEQLVLNPKTKQYEIKKVQVASKQSKLASDNSNEVNEAGTKIVSRQLIKKSVKPKDNQEQSEEEEDVTYVYEEEQLVLNPKTKQYEIKKVQVASKQSKLASDNLNEVNEAGTKIVSRQLIKKSVKPKDNQEQSEEEEEEEDVTYVYEEEQLVLNPKTKQYEIKKVQVASKQSKLASDNLNEVNEAGTKIVSRQLIKKSVKPKDNQEQSEEEEDVTYVYEEEQLVLNPKTKQYEIKKVQVASKQSKLASDNLNEVNEAGTKIVSRQLIKKSVKPKDNQEQSEEEEDVTYVYEEEQLVLNPKTKQYEIKKVQVASKQSKLASDNLNEVNEAGTKIVSRQLIKKSVKPKDNQEQSEEEEDVTYVYEEEQLVLNPKTKQYEIKKVQVASKQSKLASDNLNEVNEAGTKIVSRQLIKKSVKPKDNQEQSEEEEDVTYVYEEEQLVLNPKTKQYEIKKVQVASKQSKLASDNLNEVNEAGTKIVSRQLIKKSVKPKDNQEQSEEEEDVTYVYEEEQLVLNPKTKQYEIKKVQVASKQSKLASDNLNEVNEAGTKIVSRQLIKKSVKPKDNQEQSEEEEYVTYVYEEEQLVLNPKTKQYEIKKVQIASKQSKLASDNLNEVNEAGTKIVSRQLIKKSVKPKDNQEQSEEEEDVTYVYEEEQLVLNPKTKQYEIKKVQIASKQSKLASDNLNEVNEAGTKIVSRQLIKKSVKPKDNQEQSEEEEDVTYVYEEEQLVLNPKTKQYEIKKVQIASKQSKLASDNLNEVNEAGTKIVSRQLIKKSVKPKDNQEQSEEEEYVTYVYEEEQLVLNPKTKQYEIKKVQIASKQSKLASDNLNEVNEAGTKIVSRQLIKKSVKPKDNQEQSEEEEDVTYVYEEEQLVLNPKTKQYEIKKVQIASKQSKLASDNLNEVNEAGTKIVSRQLIKKSVKPKDNQEQSEEEEDVIYVYEEEQLVLNPKTKQYEIKKVQIASKQSKLASDNLNEVNEAGTKIVSRQLIKKSVKPKDNQEQSEEEEDVTYVYEEEQLVLNPKTKQYEIKKVQVASKQSKLASDNLNEVNEAGTKIVSRQLIKKSVKPKDNQEQSEEEEDVTYVYEEEQLVLNPKTKQYEIKKVQVASKQSKLASDNLNEVNEAGTKIVSRQLIKKSVKPKDNQEQSEEEEDVTYVYEEEQLVLNPKTKQYEIKKVQVASKQPKLASDNLNEVNEAGTKIVKRKLITKAHQSSIIKENEKQMFSIDEDSQEQRDSQYRSAGEKLQMKVTDKQVPQTTQRSEIQNYLSDNKRKDQNILVEEEIIVKIENDQKYERHLIRRLIKQKQHPLSEELNEQIDSNLIVSRVVAQPQDKSEMLKQGWVQSTTGVHHKIIQKNEFLDYYEEVHNSIDVKKKSTLILQIRIPKIYQQEKQLGLRLNEKLEDGTIISSRIAVKNQSLAYYKRNEFIFNQKDGTYSRKSIQEQQFQVKIPKYTEQVVKRSNSQLATIQEIERINQSIEEDFQKMQKVVTQNDLDENLKHKDKQFDNILNQRTFTESEDILNDIIVKEENQFEQKQSQSQTRITNSQLTPSQHIQQTNNEEDQNQVTNAQLQNMFQNLDQNFNEQSNKDKEQIQIQIKQGFFDKDDDIDILQQFKARQDLKPFDKKQMYQIDEDSQEQRDSQYRSADEKLQMKVTDYESPRTTQKSGILNFQSDTKRKDTGQLEIQVLVEEEIIAKNEINQKYERRLIRRFMLEKEHPLSDELNEQIEQNLIVSRQIVQPSDKSDMLKQGWVELSPDVHQKIVQKNEFLDYYEEVHHVIDAKTKNTKIIQIRIPRKDQIEKPLALLLKEKLANGTIVSSRTAVKNQSMAFYKKNGFVKNNLDGSYSRSQQSEQQVKVIIPKYSEQSSKMPSPQLTTIQAIENSNGQSGQSKSKSMNIPDQFLGNSGGRDSRSQPHNEIFDDGAIINKTAYSDVSETEKMFIRQLESKDNVPFKKSKSSVCQNVLGDDQRGRVASEKKSSSSKFSDSFGHQYDQTNNIKSRLMGSKVIFQVLDRIMRNREKQYFDKIIRNIENRKKIESLFGNIIQKQVKKAFDQLLQNMLCYSRSKNVNTIEFNEDDLIKYNQMLSENKIIQLDQPDELEEQSEPIELVETPPTEEKQTKQLLSTVQQMGKYFTQLVKKPIQQSNQNSPQNISTPKNQVQSAKQPSLKKSASGIVTTTPGKGLQSAQQRSQFQRSSIKLMSSKTPGPSDKQQQVKGLKTQIFTSQFAVEEKNSHQDSSKIISQKSINQSYASSRSKRLSQGPITPSQATSQINQSQNSSSMIQQKNMSQQQLALQQKEKIASQFKRMGSSLSNQAFKPKK